MKVLYVEDEGIYIRTVQRVTDLMGYELLSAADGAQALKLLDEQPDLIIADMSLPDMDGLDLTRKIRAILPDIPILALTGRTMAGDEEACLAAGCAKYIAKPVKVEELISLLRSYQT